MFLAYVNIVVKDEIKKFAIIGKNQSEIIENSLKYGSEPIIVSELYKLSKFWK